MTWKEKYIPWYRTIESIFGDLVPNLTDEDIIESVFDTDWLIIKKRGDRSRNEAKDRPVPNIFMSLHQSRIHLGLAYENIASIELFKNILHVVHNPEKSDLIKYLKKLDERFTTVVYKRTRENYPLQEFDYDPVYRFKTNKIDPIKLEVLIEKSDSIRREGRKEMRIRDISWPIYTPSINLFDVHLDADIEEFSNVLKKIKPIYEIILNIKTTGEIIEEIKRRNRITKLEARNVFFCPGCGEQYTLEDYHKYRFCPSCGTSRATWVRGDKL